MKELNATKIIEIKKLIDLNKTHREVARCFGVWRGFKNKKESEHFMQKKKKRTC